MSERWPQVPPGGDDFTRFVRFRALLRRLSAQPGPQCGLCNRTFFTGQSVILLYCGHILHRDCAIDADYLQLIERQPERHRCPHCNNPILAELILPIPQTPPGLPPGSSAAPAA